MFIFPPVATMFDKFDKDKASSLVEGLLQPEDDGDDEGMRMTKCYPGRIILWF